jgi:hypothetical protein
VVLAARPQLLVEDALGTERTQPLRLQLEADAGRRPDVPEVRRQPVGDVDQ